LNLKFVYEVDIMKYAFLTLKENPEIILGELKSVLNVNGKYKIEEMLENLIFVEIEKIDLEIINRLALTKEVFIVLAEFNKIEDLNVKFKVKKDYCVREHVLDGKKSNLEKTISKIIYDQTKKEVNFKNPTDFFRIFIYKNRKFLCKKIWKNENKFETRKNQHRPFKFPTSAHPKWARVFVNLTEIKKGKKIFDPFCGTGGFLIEAGLIGAKVYGSDISKKMVNGTRENLEFFGIRHSEIKQSDISKIDEKFKEKFDACVTGLPYGIASKKIGETTELFLENIPNKIRGKIVFTSNLNKIKFKERVLKSKYEIYIHKNLSNFIYVLN